jgi:hypothetical protein
MLMRLAGSGPRSTVVKSQGVTAVLQSLQCVPDSHQVVGGQGSSLRLELYEDDVFVARISDTELWRIQTGIRETKSHKDCTFGDDEKVSGDDAEFVQDDLVLFTCIGDVQCRRVWQKRVGLLNGLDDRGGGSIAVCGLILLDLR